MMLLATRFVWTGLAAALGALVAVTLLGFPVLHLWALVALWAVFIGALMRGDRRCSR